MSSGQCARICDTIAIGDTSYEYMLIWSQSSTNRFLAAVSCTHWVCNHLTITANDRTLIWPGFIGAKYIVFCNWVVSPYIEWKVSHATQDIWIPSPVCSHKEGVVNVRIDSYRSIRFTGLLDINRSVLAYLLVDSAYSRMPWWFGIDNISSHQEWTIESWVNSLLLGD
jgi:hypothetical protein